MGKSAKKVRTVAVKNAEGAAKNKLCPAITIVTVTYNLLKAGREEYIKENIMSVHNQSYKNIEHLVIDGASTDGTLDLLRPYAQKGWIKLISEPDKGIYDAMNKGMKAAKGDYIIILNSDDYLSTNALSLIFEDKDFDYPDCIFCGVNIINRKGEKISTKFPVYYDNSDLSYFLNSEPYTQGQIIKKDVYTDLGFYDTKYKIAADWDFFIRVLNSNKYKIKVCYCALSYFRLGGLSDSQDAEAIRKHIEERAALINFYFPELTTEQAEFAAKMQWRNADEIKGYWQNYNRQDFSEKFVLALSDMLKYKQGPTEMHADLFRQSKQEMIDKLNDLPVLKPAEDDEVVICMASDQGYEAHLYVAISTIIKQIKSNQRYHFYIFDGGLAQKHNFYAWEEKCKQVKFDFIDMREQFRQVFVSRHVSVATYYRLAMFWMFKQFKRVLYIDADSLLLEDIAELFNTDMKGKIIGGVRDSLIWQKSCKNKLINHNDFKGRYIDYEKEVLGHSDAKLAHYFNAGVLLLDFSKTDVTAKREKLKKLLLNDYYCHDQDILNLLYDETETFDFGREWCYFNVDNALRKDDYLVEDECDNYYYARVSPKLVSFVIKPWTWAYINCDFSREYWKELRQSPYYAEVVSKMNAQKSKCNLPKEVLGGVNKYEKCNIQYKLFGFIPLVKIKNQ